MPSGVFVARLVLAVLVGAPVITPQIIDPWGRPFEIHEPGETFVYGRGIRRYTFGETPTIETYCAPDHDITDMQVVHPVFFAPPLYQVVRDGLVGRLDVWQLESWPHGPETSAFGYGPWQAVAAGGRPPLERTSGVFRDAPTGRLAYVVANAPDSLDTGEGPFASRAIGSRPLPSDEGAVLRVVPALPRGDTDLVLFESGLLVRLQLSWDDAWDEVHFRVPLMEGERALACEGNFEAPAVVSQLGDELVFWRRDSFRSADQDEEVWTRDVLGRCEPILDAALHDGVLACVGERSLYVTRWFLDDPETMLEFDWPALTTTSIAWRVVDVKIGLVPVTGDGWRSWRRAVKLLLDAPGGNALLTVPLTRPFVPMLTPLGDIGARGLGGGG